MVSILYGMGFLFEVHYMEQRMYLGYVIWDRVCICGSLYATGFVFECGIVDICKIEITSV